MSSGDKRGGILVNGKNAEPIESRWPLTLTFWKAGQIKGARARALGGGQESARFGQGGRAPWAGAKKVSEVTARRQLATAYKRGLRPPHSSLLLAMSYPPTIPGDSYDGFINLGLHQSTRIDCYAFRRAGQYLTSLRFLPKQKVSHPAAEPASANCCFRPTHT